MVLVIELQYFKLDPFALEIYARLFKIDLSLCFKTT